MFDFLGDVPSHIWSLLSALGVGTLISGILVKLFYNATGVLTDALIDIVSHIKKTSNNAFIEDIIDTLIAEAANVLDDKKGEEKKEWVIKKLQQMTPDLLISDKTVDLLVEDAYQKLKKQLKENIK